MASESDISLTRGAQLARAEQTLAAAGSPAPREEAVKLLSHVLSVPVSELLARPAVLMWQPDVRTYSAWVARRASGEAVPHITGHLSFMDLDLAVERTTPLVPGYAPRLVEIALECARRSQHDDLLAAEIGTGCGAVALALAAFEPRFARVYALDPSTDALRTATSNGARYLLNLVIIWQEGEELEAVPEPVDLVVRADVSDARSAAFVGLAHQASSRLREAGTVVCGLAHGQEEAAALVLQRALPRAHMWTEPHPDGVIVVTQLPRLPSGGAALEMEK